MPWDGISEREGLEETIVIQQKIAEMVGGASDLVKIEAFVDNEDLYKSIYSTKQTLKGRLLIDMGIIKDMVDSKEVEAVHWLG